MLTYANIFEAHADEFPDAVAITHGDVEVTWSQYDEHAARLAVPGWRRMLHTDRHAAHGRGNHCICLAAFGDGGYGRG